MRLKCFFLILIFFKVSQVSKAATITLIASTNWSAITGGSGPGGLPSSSDDIIVKNAAVLTVNSTSAVCNTIALGIAGGGSNGTGTLTFAASGSPVLTVTGAITIGNGAKSGTLTMVSGATLKCGGLTVVTFGSYTAGGTIEFTATNSLPSANILTYANLTISGGTTTLGAAITSVTGTLTVKSGATLSMAFAISSVAALALDCGGSSAATISGSGTLTLAGNVTVSDNTGGTVGATISCPVALGAVTRTITVADDGTTADDLDMSGIISSTGAFGIIKAGAGTMELSALNTYTGSTTVTAGTLRATNNTVVASTTGPFGNNATGLSLNGGTIESNVATFSRPITVDATGSRIDAYGSARTISSNISGSGTFTLTLGGTTVTSAEGQDLTLSGNITSSSGTLSLNKSTTSSVTLSGASSTFAGGVTLGAGTLVIGSTAGLGSTSGTFTITGGTLDASSALSLGVYPLAINGAFTFTGSNTLNLGSGTTSMNGNYTITVTASTLTIGGTFNEGTRNLTKSGAGTLAFGSNAVTLSALTISAGTLTSTTGTLSIAGNFSNSGTFTHNNGTVTFNGTTQNIGGPTTFYNLTIGASGTKTITTDTVKVEGALTPSAGTLATAGMLAILSNATNTGNVLSGSGTISGNVRVQRFIPALAGRRFRFLASPITNTNFGDWKGEIHITGAGGTLNGFDQTNTNAASAYTYTESTTGLATNGWNSITNGTTTSLTAGQGYRVFVRGTRDPLRLDGSASTQDAVTLDLTGTLNTADVSPTISFTSSSGINEDGWNFLGNPFASAWDWNAFHDTGRNLLSDSLNYQGTSYNHVGPSAYIYNATTNSYNAYNAVSNTAIGSFTSGIIPSGASFFIHASTASPTITLKESFRVSTAPGALFKTSDPLHFGIKMIKDSINEDEMVLGYSADAKDETDGMDIPKLYGAEVNIATITTSGDFLAANFKRLPASNTDTVRLSVGIRSAGTYQFEFKNVDALIDNNSIPVWFIDKLFNQRINIRDIEYYNFAADIADANSFGNNRFMIALGTYTSVESLNPFSTNHYFVYPTQVQDMLQIHASRTQKGIATIQIIDITGKTVVHPSEMNWDKDQIAIPVSSLRTGVYVIQMYTCDNNQPVMLRFVKN